MEAQIWRIASATVDETLEIANKVGSKLRGGEVIELISDLGGGKTAFARGLAQGMGSSDTVHSPSYTLGNEYQAGRLMLYHFDFYRLEEPGIMRNELAEYINDPTAVVVVEWANIVEDVLPVEKLSVTLQTTGETNRDITIAYPESLHYLIPHNT